MANELKKILSYPANDIDKILQQGIYSVKSEEERESLALAIKTTNRTVYVRDTRKMYVWDGMAWSNISPGGEGDGRTIIKSADDKLQAIGLADQESIITATQIKEAIKYVPTSSGEKGQILQSSGENTPEWVTPSFATKQELESTAQEFTQKVEQIELLAKNAQQVLSFANYEEAIEAINKLDATAYKVGQDILIVTSGVPDLWVSKVNTVAEDYEYKDDATVVDALKKGSIIVGYYTLTALESDKGSLDNYYTKNETDELLAGLSLEGEPGIERLIGTEEAPINFATTLKSGKLYSCSGTISAINNIIDTSHEAYGKTIFIGSPYHNGIPVDDAYLIYKPHEGRVVVLNTNIVVGDTYIRVNASYYANTKFDFDEEGKITDLEQGMMFKKVNDSVFNLEAQRNGIYVPTTVGQAGQVLQSNGAGAPIWTDMPAYATEEFVNNAIANAMSKLTSISFETVTELPTENISTTTIYLKAIEGGETNTYEEYVYINGKWEVIGIASGDLSNFVTNEEFEGVSDLANTALQPEDAVNTSDIDEIFNI